MTHGGKRIRTWIQRIGLVLTALVLVIIVLPWTIGTLMSREHEGEGSVVVDAPIENVWRSVSGFDDMGSWAPDIAAMVRVADVNGLPSFEMRTGGSMITFTFTEVTPPSRLVVSLGDDREAYGGVWTYTLEPVGDAQTRVTITEKGWTAPAYFRFILWVVGHNRTIEGYLSALQKKHAGLPASSGTAPSVTAAPGTATPSAATPSEATTPAAASATPSAVTAPAAASATP